MTLQIQLINRHADWHFCWGNELCFYRASAFSCVLTVLPMDKLVNEAETVIGVIGQTLQP